MKNLVIVASVLLVFSRQYKVIAVLPGPRVYVVTPSPRPLQIDEGRSVPFYYHNWIRRMDGDNSAANTTTTTTTALPNLKTPDLIFAEFETGGNDNMKKTIRKLLEKEKVVPKTTTTTTSTSRPIYVPDEEYDKVTRVVNYGIPINMKQDEQTENKPSGGIDYFSMYNKLYENMPAPVYLPSTQSTTTTTTTTTSTIPESSKVENIWHIIDSEKSSQYSGNWEEVPVKPSEGDPKLHRNLSVSEDGDTITKQNSDEDEIDDNFAFPGLGTNPGLGAENESRAIRTEPNLRFPYVNLKPFMLKSNKKPTTNYVTDKKKGNNLITSLDSFHDLKNPVRGEAQDNFPTRDIIDRYNPAQPYLPQPEYGSKNSKQNSISSPPKATANLVPPPPPPAPKVTANDFPALTSYESFPPYAPPSFDSTRPASPPPKPITTYSAPAVETSDDSDSSAVDDFNINGSPMDFGYHYRQPASPPMPPIQQFIPTIPPINKPFKGYSYDKPPMSVESPMMATMDDKPDFHGYHYNKPEPAAPPSVAMPPTYGHHDASPPYGHDSDFPELIFSKHHGDDDKGSDDMKGMVPPPPDMKPDDHSSAMDDHGFPSDFPGDLKYHLDFDDHYYHHHHHTTTTTTEMPRVNRYSYYYLGKKLYYLPLYFSVYFIVYVGALIIKAVLRHKIVYPNSWRPNGTTATFFSKRSVDSYLSNENLHEVTGKVTHAIATAAEKYLSHKSKKQ